MVVQIGDPTAEFQGLLSEYEKHPTAALADQLAAIGQKITSITSDSALNTQTLETNQRVLARLMDERRALPTVKGPPDARDALLRVNMEYWIYVGGVVACVVVACLVGYWSQSSGQVQTGGQMQPSNIYSLGGLAAISLMLVGALSIKSYALLFVWGALVLCHLLMVRALRR